MSYRGSAEVTRTSAALQVVLVPASALRVFVRMAIESDAGTGVFWHVNEDGEYAGPYMRQSQVPAFGTCVQSHGAWDEMMHAAHNLPVWAAVAAQRTVSQGERWVVLPKKVVQQLTAPACDGLWGNWSATTDWTGPLIEATFALLESECVADDLEDEQARRDASRTIVAEVAK